MNSKRESVCFAGRGEAHAKKFGNGRIVAENADTFTVEFKGPLGSRNVFRKVFNRTSTIAAGETDKLIGIAHRLPPPAFDALFEESTIELMLNPDGIIWQEKLGEGMVEVCPMEESFSEEFIRRIAGYLRKTVTRENPILEGVLPLDDSRIAAQLPPVVAHPAFSIRKRAVRIFTLEEYVTSCVMSAAQCALIKQAVRDRKNIVVLGGTGSGKTTLGNAVLHEITVCEPQARQIIIEDTAELNSAAVNRVNFQVSEQTSMTSLIRATLRMRPDRVIVGEVRGSEAFDLLQVWNTGHPGGLCTLHANDCVSALRRLKSLVSQHPLAPRDIEPDIALAVDLMVNIVKSGRERKVREIAEVREYDPKITENNGYRLVSL